MKTVFMTIAALFLASAAQAGEFSQPQSVLFQSASAYVPAAKVCRDGNFLKHVSKKYVDVKVENGDSQGDYTIVRKELLQPVVSTAERCVKTAGRDGDRCVAWKSFPLDQSKVRVITYSSASAMEDGKGGRITGSYTIPACK